MEIKDVLEEDHYKTYNLLLEIARKSYKEEGLLPPLLGVFARGHEKFIMCPGTLEGFTDQTEKDAIHVLIKEFITFLKEEKNLDPYVFVMFIEVYMKRMHKQDKDSLERIKKEGVENEELKDEGLMILVNTTQGDFNTVYEIIRDGDSFVVSEEPTMSVYNTSEEVNKANREIGNGRFRFFGKEE